MEVLTIENTKLFYPNNSYSDASKLININLESKINTENCKLQIIQVLKKEWKPILNSFLIYILMGMNDGNFGIILPQITNYYNLSNSIISILFLTQSIGYFISSFGNGWIIHKLNLFGSLFLGSFFIFISYILIFIALPFPAMCVWMIFLGYGIASIETGANVYLTELPYSTIILNISHAFYSFGAIIGTLIASNLLNRNFSWKTTYIILCGISAFNIIFIFFAFYNIKNENKKISDIEITIKNKGIFHEVISYRFTWIVSIYLFLYTGIEVIFGQWTYIFLTKYRHGDAIKMGQVMSAYWAAITFGRIILGYITSLFSEEYIILFYLIITLVMELTILLFSKISTNICALITIGFVIAPIFPTTIALVNKFIPKKLHSTIIGFLSGFAQIGAALLPFINGQLISIIGIWVMIPFIISITGLLILIWLYFLYKSGGYNLFFPIH